MMNVFKNITQYAFLLFGVSLLFFIGANNRLLAEDLNAGFCSGEGSQTTICQTSKKNSESAIFGPDGLITRIVQTLIFLTGAISVLMVMVGGFRYIISGGDSSGIQGAKNTIIYALVGLVVAVFAQVIVSLVLSKL